MYNLQRKLRRFIEIKPSLKKLINYFLNKISKSMAVSGYNLGMPHRFFLEITNLCNLKCMLCPTGNGLLRRKKTEMTFADCKMIVEEMADYIIEVGIGGFGEPFLNKDIYRMVKYMKDKGIFVEIYTNLLSLDKEGLERIVDFGVDRLIVSLDAWDANSYLAYKGIDGFSKVLDNLRYLVDIKKHRQQEKPCITLQFIMVKGNLNHTYELRTLAEDLGVDILSFKSPNLYLGNSDSYPDLELAERFLTPDFNRYRFDAGGILPCPWVWDSLIIYANGDVGPCCYDAQGDFVFGNIFLEKILTIWNNKNYREFRKDSISKTDNHRLCTLCMERHKGTGIAIEYSLNKFRL